MRIGVIGLGYVGLVTALVLANQGNDIIGIDSDKKKIGMLSSGKATIYEPGLDDLLLKVSSRIIFSDDYGPLADAEAIFVIVPTPVSNDRIDLSYVRSALGAASKINKSATFIIKSTAVPGTAEKFSAEFGIKIVSNPEFTKEGTGIQDTEHPNRVVIGSPDEASGDLVEAIWSFTRSPVIRTNNKNAELTKYASNAFLATKISFINEIANLCEKIPGCDVEVIAKAMGLDERIGPHFLKAGLGWGGSCFPKDTKAIVTFAKDLGEQQNIIESAVRVNDGRIDRAVSLVKKVWGKGDLSNVRVGMLGVAFKGDTDDIRDSQAVKLMHRLVQENAKVGVYDPKAKVADSSITVYASKEDCVKNSDIILVTTDWKDFSRIYETVGDKPIVDTRRIFTSDRRNIFSIGKGEA